MTNSFFESEPEMVLPESEKFGTHHLPMSFQEKLLDIYWLKKEITTLLEIDNDHVNDSLSEVSQLLAIVEVQIIRILHSASKNDAAYQEYWGF